jgi:chromosome segregation ATPase
MPKVALADTLVDWDLLIRTARKKADSQPELAALLDQLEERLGRVRALDVERLALKAKLLQATQDLKQARDEGKSFALRARSLLKAMLGLSHEGLLEFRVRPRRPYGKRKPKPDAKD